MLKAPVNSGVFLIFKINQLKLKTKNKNQTCNRDYMRVIQGENLNEQKLYQISNRCKRRWNIRN